MKLVLADIHGNLEALESVLESVDRKYDLDECDVLCPGDIVGYGPNPSKCIKQIRELDAGAVPGNHDAATVERLSTEWFNHMAREALRWTRDQLGSGELEFLEGLPDYLETEGIYIVHGSPREPFREYITSARKATSAIDDVSQPLLLTGHTHKPAFFRGKRELARCSITSGQWISVDLSVERLVVNPGSVGQPRDGNPDASYMLIDLEQSRVCWERVSYPIDQTQRKIRKAGLPDRLASRLRTGE